MLNTNKINKTTQVLQSFLVELLPLYVTVMTDHYCSPTGFIPENPSTKAFYFIPKDHYSETQVFGNSLFGNTALRTLGIESLGIKNRS